MANRVFTPNLILNSELLSLSPLQLFPQQFKIVTIGRLNQKDLTLRLSDFNDILKLKRKSLLTIECQGHLFLSRLEDRMNRDIIRNDDGPVGQGMGTDRGDDEVMKRRIDNGSPCGKVVGRRTGRC